MGLLLLAPGLRAEDTNDERLLRAQAAGQRQAQRARELLDRLRLSRLQARRLAPIAEQAATLHLEAYELEAQFLPEMLAAFGQFAREDSLNRGFTREVERRTAGLNHRAQEARDRITAQLIALEEQASKILTSSQRERLTHSPREQLPVPARAARMGARRRARAAERQREQARKGPLRAARRELSALQRQRHPQTGPIGQYLLHPFGAEQLCEVARVRTPEVVTEAADTLRHGTSEHPAELVERQRAEVRELRAEINNWNLINGLHLSGDQIEQIVASYDRAASRTWEDPRRDHRSGVPHQALVALERDVEQGLNAGQRQVLADYKPCLIPPKKLKDPVRVGQASENSRYERWLARARKLSRHGLTKHIELLLEREAKHLGEFKRAERQKRVALLRKTVQQASARSETEFELDKAELARRIAPADRVQEVKNKVAALARQYGEPGPIAHFMLKPRFIDQLRLRGQQLAAGLTPEQADLAAGPQAENCEVSCATDGKRGKGRQKK